MGIQNAHINNKNATYWHFKCHKCFIKFVLGIRRLAFTETAFMKLTPGASFKMRLGLLLIFILIVN